MDIQNPTPLLFFGIVEMDQNPFLSLLRPCEF
jgi:hypothetical protein